jgi:hypothetical protein
MRVTVSAGTEVVCPGCGVPRPVSKKQAYRIRLGNSSALCSLCRRPRPRVRVTDAERRFWLERFTLPEICEMAAAIEEALGMSGRSALTASGERKPGESAIQ